jgi:hypothetical protein
MKRVHYVRSKPEWEMDQSLIEEIVERFAKRWKLAKPIEMLSPITRKR